MPERDESLFVAMQRLERVGFYATPKIDPLVAAAETVLKESATAVVDTQLFRKQFYELKAAVDPLRENILRDIERLKQSEARIPHVAPAEIAKRKQWINKLAEVQKILDTMMETR